MTSADPGINVTESNDDQLERQRLIAEYRQRIRDVRRKGLKYMFWAAFIMTFVLGVAFTSGRIFVWLFAFGLGMGAWGVVLASIPKLILEQFPAADE